MTKVKRNFTFAAFKKHSKTKELYSEMAIQAICELLESSFATNTIYKLELDRIVQIDFKEGLWDDDRIIATLKEEGEL